jgi:hypothetical protein
MNRGASEHAYGKVREFFSVDFNISFPVIRFANRLFKIAPVKKRF